MKMLSPHFSWAECACRCGCGQCDVSPRLMGLAEKVRAVLNRPMIVHSVCRCARHNKSSGGADNSRHIKGQAMDFHCDGLAPQTIYDVLWSAFNSGRLPELGALFIYDWGVHIDVRAIPDGRLRTGDYRKVKSDV